MSKVFASRSRFLLSHDEAIALLFYNFVSLFTFWVPRIKLNIVCAIFPEKIFSLVSEFSSSKFKIVSL